MKKYVKYIPYITGAIFVVGIIFIVSIIFSFNDKALALNEDMSIILSLLFLILILTILGLYGVFLYSYIKKKQQIKKEKAKLLAGQCPDPRFYMLSQIDDKYKDKEDNYEDLDISLKDIAEGFKAFSESKLNLYYDIEDVRRFIAGLATSHIMILQGMSGTGKTSLAYAFGEYINNKSSIIPIQPMWKERTDLIGYYNEFTKKFNETELLNVLYEANYTNKMYLVVLDEVNIARVEYYFAEFLSILELPNKDARLLEIVSDRWDNDPKLFNGGRILLKDNIWFIGTANNDDSTFAISDKVYDRAMIMNLNKKANKNVTLEGDSIKLSYDTFNKLVDEVLNNYVISIDTMNHLTNLDNYMIKHFKLTFGNRILKQINNYIKVYVALGGNEIDALDDILSKKLFRKIEFLNPSEIKDKTPGLIKFIEDEFNGIDLSVSISMINSFVGMED